MKVKPFARQGNYTSIDNAVLDEIMPALSGSEWKVLCLIIRKTVGWHKDGDAIAYTQISKGTGIVSPSTINKAIEALKDKELIIVRSLDSWSANQYSLNTEYVVRTTEIVVGPTTEIVVGPTTESVDTKESLKEKEKKDVVFSKIIKAYENNIGQLTPIIQESIQADIEEYPEDWIIEAIGIASKNNARSLRYVETILFNWQTKGKDNHKANSASNAPIAAAWDLVKYTVSNHLPPTFQDSRILEAVRPMWPELKTLNPYNERELKLKFERNYNAIN